MESRVTQCPQCGTAFRVTQQQLQLATGRVRCGSCLHVFVAAQHWAAQDVEPTAASDTTPATSADWEAAATQAVSGAMEFSDAFLELDGKVVDEADHDVADPADDSGEDDEHWARRILAEEESAKREPRNELLEAILAAPPSQSLKKTVTDAAPTASTSYDPGEFQSGEKWVQELMADRQQDAAAAEAPMLAAAPPVLDQEPEQEYIPEIFRDHNKLIDGIQADALELHWHRHISPWLRHGLSALAIVLATALLCAQYVWFNSEQLARNPAYRSLLIVYCQLTRCAMPASRNISRIKNSNLVVLKHPRTEGALLLDTILTNYADFEQAFPSLYVEFSDLQDQPVASRTFAPQEYLRGDLVGTSTMPVRRPVHISLELVDPGERAVNYRIQLLPSSLDQSPRQR
jgi:predicted Zn finger-like uncharacterized protein